MMIKKMSKLLSVMLLLGMLLSLVPAAAFAADDSASWEKVDLESILAGDTVAITMSKDGTTWILPTTAAGGKGQPLADSATLTDNTLSADSAAYGWKLTAADGGYTIQTAGGAYLYLTADNNGVRIGDTAAVWSVTDEYLTAADSSGATRYLGVYNAQDWRCYTSINNNIKGQTLAFWRLNEDIPVDPEPTPSLSPEADA